MRLLGLYLFLAGAAFAGEFAVFANNLTNRRAELGRETRGIDRLLYIQPRKIGFAFKGAF